jgi:hypothetical protein
MDGGKLNIPLSEYPTFLKRYLKAVISKEEVSLVEKLGKSCEMRFFLDIDKTINIDEILKVASCVLQCNSYVVYKCNENHGIHIVFNFVVTNEQAQNYAKLIQDKVSNEFKKHIDASVYNTGLRMVGSVKYQNGIYQNRYYLPLGIKELEELTIQDLKTSIVRLKTLDTIEKYVAPLNDLSKFSVLHKYVPKINKNYADISFTRCKKIHDYYCINTNSKFCCNLETNHKSCGVYFILSPENELYQKCFCPCRKSNGRKHGYCCDFKSKRVKVPSSVYKSIDSQGFF